MTYFDGMKRLLSIVLYATVTLAFAGIVQARQNDVRLIPLFDTLGNTTSYLDGKKAEGDIWQIWLETGSDTSDYLVIIGMQYVQQGRFQEALKTFTSITKMDPDYAEGWNKRATVLFLMGELEYSILDIYKTLDLEPRHFGALAGLGQIYDKQDKLKDAIGAFEQAAKINPHMTGVNLRLKQLRKQLDDQNI